MDSLDIGVVGKSVLSEFSADTRLLEASERYVGVELVVAVDPDGTGLQLVGDAEGMRDIAREDSGGETVDRVVGDLDQVSLVLPACDDDCK